MKRTTLNAVVDGAGFVGFVLLTTTGVLLRYVLPPGSGRHTFVWGLDRHQWGTVHFWVAVGFFAVLALHLALHWRWIAAVVGSRGSDASGLRFGLGVVGLLAVIALAAAPLLSPVERTAAGQQGRGGMAAGTGPAPGEPVIRGHMTLREVAARTGVPAAHLLDRLGLPPDTDPDTPVGRLGELHGFRLRRLRAIVREYKPPPTPP